MSHRLVLVQAALQPPGEGRTATAFCDLLVLLAWWATSVLSNCKCDHCATLCQPIEAGSTPSLSQTQIPCPPQICPERSARHTCPTLLSTFRTEKWQLFGLCRAAPKALLNRSSGYLNGKMKGTERL